MQLAIKSTSTKICSLYGIKQQSLWFNDEGFGLSFMINMPNLIQDKTEIFL